MQYIVLDLEWNQGEETKKRRKGLLFEIIEIGAVKLNDHFEVIDRFSELIRPEVFRRMHGMTQRLTGIRMEELEKNGRPLADVMQEFFAWCGEDYRFCTWGDLDLTELQRNLEYFGLDNPIPWPVYFYDVQKLYRLQYGQKKEGKALETAIEELHLEKPEGLPFHRAVADAWYTARVLQRIDMARLGGMISVDYYHLPENRSEELYLRFETYTKYVSRAFTTPEKAMKEKEVLVTRCPVCGRNCKRWIPWFTTHNRNYLCGCSCQEHGWMRGKIRLKKQYDGSVYVVRTVRFSDSEEMEKLYHKQEEIRKKRWKKRHSDQRKQGAAGRGQSDAVK